MGLPNICSRKSGLNARHVRFRDTGGQNRTLVAFTEYLRMRSYRATSPWASVGTWLTLQTGIAGLSQTAKLVVDEQKKAQAMPHLRAASSNHLYASFVSKGNHGLYGCSLTGRYVSRYVTGQQCCSKGPWCDVELHPSAATEASYYRTGGSRNLTAHSSHCSPLSSAPEMNHNGTPS